MSHGHPSVVPVSKAHSLGAALDAMSLAPLQKDLLLLFPMLLLMLLDSGLIITSWGRVGAFGRNGFAEKMQGLCREAAIRLRGRLVARALIWTRVECTAYA